MKKTVFFLLLLLAAGLSLLAQPAYTVGRNRFVLQCDGDAREYYVHVPRNYNPGTALPVVMMLHGTTGNGLRFYQISGWKELGDSLNIITVFPSSWTYCLVDDQVTGHTNTTSQWNDYGLQLCTTETQPKRDDIHFLNMVLDDVQSRFSVDASRIYLAGFSNGAGMAARCAIEMSNRLAAVVQDAGGLLVDTTLTPAASIPVMFRLGDTDSRWLRHSGVAAFPLDIGQLIAGFPIVSTLVNTHLRNFHLDTTFTSQQSGGGRVLSRTYRGGPGRPNRVFVFSLVQGLDHNYPNTRNHWMFGAAVDWLFFSRFHK